MTEMNTSPLIELRGVRRVYASAGETVAALDGIDLDLKQGEVVVMLLGPSGSGKTTLLNVLSAMDSPTEGTYRYLGEDVPTAPDLVEQTRFSIRTPHPLLRPVVWPVEAVVRLTQGIVRAPSRTMASRRRAKALEAQASFRRRNIGYVFQQYNLLGDLTVLENVMLAQEIAGARDRAHAMDMIGRVGLKGMHDRFPSELSGGQQQRVAIARSLAKKAQLLLGDEPTGNLDSETTQQVMEVLLSICRKERVTAVIVTHDESLTKHATRVLRLDSGRLQSDERGAAGTIVGKGKAAVMDALETAEDVVDTVRRPVEAALHGGLATAKALGGVAKDIADAARPKRKE